MKLHFPEPFKHRHPPVESINKLLEARNDHVVNKKAEEEIRAILEHNAAQNQALRAIYEKLANMEAGLALVSPKPPEPIKPTKLK